MYYGSPENYEWYAKRCVLYIRVSTEEQARQGYSLDAQLEALEDFAKQFCMQVVGRFTDDGVSARKNIKYRKGLTALLGAVERGEVDYILFIKLDRWFRNISEYYKVQEVLEAHGVGWKAILEDYDTSTTNGRLNLNIRLSVAQDESDRTSDRIKFVNASRIANNGAVTGRHPFALYTEGGRVHVDEEKALVVRNLFDYYETHTSMRKCLDFLSSVGVPMGYNTIKKMLVNPLYKGEYKGNKTYCSAIISAEQFDRVQVIVERQSRTRESVYEYVFTGLLTCPVCGRKMVSGVLKDPKCGRTYQRYRCPRAWIDKACTHKYTPLEGRIEKYLAANIKSEIQGMLLTYESQKNKVVKPRTDIAKIRRRLDRLKGLYLDEMIDLDAYRKDYVPLKSQLEEAIMDEQTQVIVPPNYEALNKVMQTDFDTEYYNLSTAQRRRLWLSIIREIAPVDKNTFRIVFL